MGTSAINPTQSSGPSSLPPAQELDDVDTGLDRFVPVHRPGWHAADHCECDPRPLGGVPRSCRRRAPGTAAPTIAPTRGLSGTSRPRRVGARALARRQRYPRWPWIGLRCRESSLDDGARANPSPPRRSRNHLRECSTRWLGSISSCSRSAPRPVRQNAMRTRRRSYRLGRSDQPASGEDVRSIEARPPPFPRMR